MEVNSSKSILETELDRFKPFFEYMEGESMITRYNGYLVKTFEEGDYTISNEHKRIYIDIKKDERLMYRTLGSFIGNISMSENEIDSTIYEIPFKNYNIKGNTLLEMAIEYTTCGNPEAEKAFMDRNIFYRDNIGMIPEKQEEYAQQVKEILYMLSDLGIELTPTEKMYMLRCKKEDLESELAKINEQIRQQEAEQK